MQHIPADSRPLEPASHEPVDDPGVWKRVIATKQHLMRGQVQMVNWARLPAGKSFARHFHEDMEEVFILLSGKAMMTVSGKQIELARGDALIVAPHEVHSMRNIGAGDVEYVVFGISSERGGKTVVVD